MKGANDESKKGVAQGARSEDRKWEELAKSQVVPRSPETPIGSSQNATAAADGAALGEIFMLIEG